jgi:hypothetical protein
MTTTTDQLHVPAGAIRVDEWESEKVRAFYGTSREVETENGKILIELEGEQFADGTVRRILYVSEFPTEYEWNGYKTHKEGPATGPMAFEDARKFAAALAEAAAEQAQWAQQDSTQ